MIETRRTFLQIAAALAGGAVCANLALAQRSIPFPSPSMPRPRDPFPGGDIDFPPPNPPRPNAQQQAKQMKRNQEEIGKEMAKLKSAVADLEKQLNANDTTAVLSLDTVRTTEEIEKLAKHIKELVRG